ncbi:MAG: glycosyltransferase family A protein [Candidatus Dojkabacteria bacterium]
MSKKVSIVIPYYNGRNYIEELINSIRIQTYSIIETIIVNDGSNEENSTFIEDLIKNKYAEMQIQYLKKDNEGISDTRNKGLEMSTGELITFIDQDDSLCGRYSIEFRVDYLEKNESADIVAGYNLKMDEQSKIVNKKTPERVTDIYNKACDYKNFPLEYLNYYEERNKLFFFTTGGSLIRKNVLTDIRFNKEFNQVEDIDFTLELLRAKREFHLLKLPIYIKRTHDQQASRNTPQSLEDMLLAKIKDIKKLY